MTISKILSADPLKKVAFVTLFALAFAEAYFTLSAEISTPTTESKPSPQVMEKSPEPQYASTR